MKKVKKFMKNKNFKLKKKISLVNNFYLYGLMIYNHLIKNKN